MKPRLHQKPSHSENAVHRCADFVAHGGEEARLRTAGGFGLVARIGERVFERFAFRYVASDALYFDEAARSIAHRVVFPRDPAPAIGRADMLVVAHASAAG